MKHIQLKNTDFEGLNNIYLLIEKEPLTLIDTGMSTPDTRNQFLDEFAEFGLSPEEIELILLTHWHPDHVGLAGELQDASGAGVYIHEADAPLLRERAWRQMSSIYERRFDEWGVPKEKRREVVERFTLEDDVLSGQLIDVHTFVDGDRFDAGGLELEVVHAPGHTAGLSCFQFENQGDLEVFSGDALLPVYTPNVGGADVRVEDPLPEYLTTLERFISVEYDRAWPGHRQPIDDPAGRAAEIIAHHKDRATQILEILRRHGPLDVWTVSDHLFGELVDIHIIHGPGEAYAHLAHLSNHDVIESSDNAYDFDGQDTSPLDGLFPQL